MLQHPVPDPILVAIGDVTVSFSLVENALRSLIGTMLNDPQRIGQIVTAELSFRATRALMISLYQERHGKDSDLDQLKSLMTEADILEQRRNQIMHSTWLAADKPEQVMRHKSVAKEKTGLHFSWEELSVDDIKSIATDLRELAGKIQTLMVTLILAGKGYANPWI